MLSVEIIQKPRVYSMGVEFECGRNVIHSEIRSRIDDLVHGFEDAGDGSVHVPNKPYTSSELRFWSENIENLTHVVELLMYKCNAEQNPTCGNHRHVQFLHANKTIIEQLKLKKCLLAFRDAYLSHFDNRDENRKYFARLNNYYCRNTLEWQDSNEAYEYAFRLFGNKAYKRHHDENYEKEEFSNQYFEKDRYFFVNFTSYDRHNTLEFRVFPHVYSPSEFNDQSQFLVNWLNNFKLPYKIYHLKDDLLEMFISRINRKYIIIEVKHNRLASEYGRILNLRHRSVDKYNKANFWYIDRVMREHRLSDLDSFNYPIFYNNQVNACIFRILHGYLKIHSEQFKDLSVKELVNRVVELYPQVAEKIEQFKSGRYVL